MNHVLSVSVSVSLPVTARARFPGLVGKHELRESCPSPKQKQWIKYTLSPGVLVNLPMMTVPKIKQGFTLTWSPLRYACNQGL